MAKPPVSPNCSPDCGQGGHALSTPEHLTLWLREIYGSGIGYNTIADISRLNLTHDDMRRFLLLGVPERQSPFIREVMDRA